MADDTLDDDRKRKPGGETTELNNDGKPAEPDKPPVYKRPLFWIIAAVILIVVVGGGLFYWLNARQYQSTDDAFVDAHIVRISAEVSGKLTLAADFDNRHVAAGELLAVIEPAAPQAQLAEARANVVQSIAQVKQAEAQVAAQRAVRDQAAANARAPEANATKARQDLARYLAATKADPAAVAATQIDQARAQVRSAEGQAAAARREVDAATANIAVTAKQVDAARAGVIASRARVSQSDVTIGHLNITAPIAGQLVNRQVNRGSYVAPGQQLMAIIPDKLWVTANFKETQLVDMRPGQHVDIKVDAFPDVKFEGHVDSIQRGAGQAFALLPAQNATGNYVKVVQRVPVRILFDRPDPHAWPIGPGMSVTPRVKVR